uniref:HAT C-terminal dimerisation domain-containing protein n=1 Tax=Poecilia formosa TaxID=48698 RepID=A0A087XA81_POEFO
FHAEWEEVFTMSYSKRVCLICRCAIAIPKKGNVERHFQTLHNYDIDVPPKSELRRRKVKELKSQLSGQQSFFSHLTTKAKASHRSIISASEENTETVEGYCGLCFSLQLDESTAVSDTDQLCIFVWMVFPDMNARAELLTVLPKTQLPVFKLVSITTGGAPAMVGRSNGFIAKCREDDAFPDFLSYHCFMHQQALCAKMLNMKEIMDVATKIACSIRARPLQRRLFRAHLEKGDCDHFELLLLHTDVRWLSRGKFLERFRELYPEIKEFLLVVKHAEYRQLSDDQWLLDLAFLTDLTNILNDLNIELQGQDKLINMISSVNAFKRKMQHVTSKLQRHDLTNFQNVALELEMQGEDTARYTEQIENCLSEFDRRFQDFALLEPVATFMCSPFWEDAELNSSGVENDILTLQADIELKSRPHGQFWNLLTEGKYPNMRKCATSLTALFGSTYLCESAFSHMKIIKSKYRSSMTDAHLEACLKLGI